MHENEFTIPLTKIIEEFELEVLYEAENIDSVLVGTSDINRPGLQMVGFFDYFDKSSYINYKKLTKEQYNNRLFLNNIMSKYGFKGLNEEWWHYTLINEPFKDIYFDFDIKK